MKEDCGGALKRRASEIGISASSLVSTEQEIEMNGKCPYSEALSPLHSKYCKSCSPKASLLWKGQVRLEARQSFIKERSRASLPYWLDHWLNVTDSDQAAAHKAYNDYIRRHMRARRLRLRAKRLAI